MAVKRGSEVLPKSGDERRGGESVIHMDIGSRRIGINGVPIGDEGFPQPVERDNQFGYVQIQQRNNGRVQ